MKKKGGVIRLREMFYIYIYICLFVKKCRGANKLIR